MTAPAENPKFASARFRTRLLVAMMLVVSAITALALFFAQRNLSSSVERDLRREFEGELAALVRKPRIHAALEDNALDLLYPSARDELRDVLATTEETAAGTAPRLLHAEFYRFLDRTGALIVPPSGRDIGDLRPEEEAQLALRQPGNRPELGYLRRTAADRSESVAEVIAMPIVSNDSGEVIAALVLGFKPPVLAGLRSDSGIRRGVWFGGRLHLTNFTAEEQHAYAAEVTRAIAHGGAESSFGTEIGGAPHLFFYKRLNPGSQFPPAYEVCIYPLEGLRERQWQLRWQVVGAGVLLLLGGFGASHIIAGRLAQPVARLADDSAENLAQRTRAEAALELTSGELQRAARFSADASHQLRTPVTVMRAGLEELLARDHLTPEECREISALIHQTYRLSGIIEDLLLLSRLDAGRLKLDIKPVNLSQLIEAALDDLTAVPDGPELTVETDFPADLHIAGEKRYTSLILQNLLENARKYNRPGGSIRLATRAEGEWVSLSVANSGRPIPTELRERIFERFHRGAVGENVPGYGLGLNLARELARLHGGELRLARSDDAWTEFEVRFRIVPAPSPVLANGA